MASYVLLSNCTQSITRERSIINYAHHESGSLLVRVCVIRRDLQLVFFEITMAITLREKWRKTIEENFVIIFLRFFFPLYNIITRHEMFINIFFSFFFIDFNRFFYHPVKDWIICCYKWTKKKKHNLINLIRQ